MTVIDSSAQGMFGLEEMKTKSNDFTKYVMGKGSPLHDRLPVDIVPMAISEFDLSGEDSLAIIQIKEKFIEYYDYLISYQKQNGITTNNLSSIFIESANDAPDQLTCFGDWYKRDVHTIAITLACYNSDLDSVKESCIARSIHATIINNAAVAECFERMDAENK